MPQSKLLLPLIFVYVWLTSCSQEEDMPMITPTTEEQDDLNTLGDNLKLADTNAVKEVELLYRRLDNIRQLGVAFGHQDATAYGINWEHSGFPSDSDVLRVAGDYPAVIGFDIGNIESGSDVNIDGVSFELMKLLIQEAHEKGSIITISWHANNPITGQLPWDITRAIPSILPGESNYHIFENYLAKIAAFFMDLKDENGQPIPIIFRPWHEMNGDWFWWGNVGHTAEEYKQLYRETVRHLTNRFGVHNLLYCYSPDRSDTEDKFLEYYPGDDWVDLLGVDVYDFFNGRYIDDAKRALTVLQSLADEKQKLFAFTETGLENVLESNWWTQNLYPAIRGSGAVYVLVWRNENVDHFFGPYKAHPSADDFRSYAAFPDVLLQADIQ